MLGAVAMGQKEWVTILTDLPQCRFLNQAHRGVGQPAVGSVEGTRLHQILHGGCISLWYTGVQIKVADVVVGCSEAKKDASEIIAIQFPASVTAALDTHP